ncbi:MAG: nitroreductase family protein [Candidatus Bathyarchaeia archaeon]
MTETKEAEVVLKVIKERRSIRKYKPDPIPDELILKCLEAARWAPTGEDAQPWRFIIVKDQKTREKIGEIAGRGSGRRFTVEFYTGKMLERFGDKIKTWPEEKRKRVFEKLTSGKVSAFLAEAPVNIVVCAYKNVWDPREDCSAAIQNMLLMAKALGLGTCWVIGPVTDVRDELKVKELLGIPEEYKVVSVVALGYPDEDPKPRPRKELEEVTFYERFGQKKEGVL